VRLLGGKKLDAALRALHEVLLEMLEWVPTPEATSAELQAAWTPKRDAASAALDAFIDAAKRDLKVGTYKHQG
jgi:hypothetical protein